MEQLRKKRYTGRGKNDKYYIDCNRYEENPDSIEIKTLIKNTKKTDVTILQAIASDETIKNHHDVVVKISRNKTKKEYMAQKEYKIGERLNQIPGFIKYICLFACFDDTNTNFETIEVGEESISIKTKICNANEKIMENWKYVLIMPYIKEGSLENYNWTIEKREILKNVIIQTVLSLAIAFEKVGFVHNDLHWGNVLIKKTKKKNITYEFTKEKRIQPIHGYKVLIMDFEKSYIGETNSVLFWTNVLTFFQRIAGLQNEKNEMIIWYNKKVISFIENRMNKKMSADNAVKLIKLHRPKRKMRQTQL